MSCRRKRENELIHISSINEELKLIEGSSTDYITPSGKVYKWYHDDMYYPKKTRINNKNKYIYVSITFNDNKNRDRRLHVLMAKAYIPNPDPEHLKIVGHKDDNKQHNELSNLYWTDNRENTQSAVNHGLNDQPKAEQNKNSVYIKVLDKNTKKIVGIYGSIRECARCIDNVTASFIAKVYKKKNYKPRSKKYIYQEATEEEFNSNLHIRNARLIENPKADKSPKIFYLINDFLNYKEKFDNQVAASKVCNIPQAIISNMIKEGYIFNGWRCEYINSTNYAEASSYNNFINTINSIVLQHIKTKEVKTFDTFEELKKYLGINGHDIRQYLKTGHTLMNEWKVIDITSKNNLKVNILEDIS